MLQSIHDKISGWVAKVLLGALLVVFIFWGVELHSVNSVDSVAAEVNGDDISLTTLRNEWQRQQMQLQQAFKGEIPEEFKRQQQQVLLDRMIRTQLLVSHASAQGFHVSDQKMANMLKEMDALKVDGKFSRERYATALLQQGMSEPQFEARLRTEIAANQVQSGIQASAFVTPGELARARALLGEQREVDYLIAPLSSFVAAAKPTDTEVQAWYDAHKDSYLTDESVDLQYVELKLANVSAAVQIDDATLKDHYDKIKDRYATEERRRARHILIKTSKDVDDAAAKKKADELLAKVNGGADFAMLAREFSQDAGSANKGGDLDWATRGMFVGPFEDALFGMKPGEVRGPVKSEFGYHIIKLDEVEAGGGKSFEQVRAEVEDDYKAEQSRAKFYDQTQKLADEALAHSGELTSVAKTFNTSVQTINAFTRKGAGEFAGNASVIDAAFSDAVLNKGENSALITLGEDRALVLRVAEHHAPAQRSLDEVRAAVVTALTDQQARTELAAKASAVLKQLQSGELAWANVNKSLPAAAVGKKFLGRSVPGVDAAILQAAFGVTKSSITPATPAYRAVPLSNGDYAVLVVSQVQSGSEASDASGAAGIEQRVGQSANGDLVAYMNELQREAKIKRNPKAFE